MSNKHWPDWLTLVVGVWMIVSPFVLQFSGQVAAMWNAVVLGIVVALIALGAVYKFRIWEEWLNFILGLWLIISPWALEFSNFSAATWNHAVTGILVAVFALWEITLMEGWKKLRA